MSKSPANDFDKISPTALMTSISRQFTDIPYSQELANIAAKQLTSHFSLILESRYKAINQVMAQYPITQILELASGLLPRGLTLSADPNITFIESDLGLMLSYKQHAVHQLVDVRPNLHFLEINATSRPSEFTKVGDYFDAQKPVMVLCEGLLMYLTMAEKELVCTNVRELLQQYGGVWITPDFTSTIHLRKTVPNDANLQNRLTSLTHLTGRSLLDNSFESIEHAQEFVANQGFQLVEHRMDDLLDQMSCVNILSLDLDYVKMNLANHSVFALSLAPREGEN